MSLNIEHEQTYWRRGYHFVVGVDEVGRGCLAGPVVAAAVGFAKGHKIIHGIHDSKVLSPSARNNLSNKIYEQAVQVSIATVSVGEINSQGISAATKTAMRHALAECKHIDIALIDGIWKPSTTYAAEAIVHGDRLCYSIAAASIVAKVYRDQLMHTLHLSFPEYKWNQNKGYGTLWHRKMLKKIGPSPHHRTLFIRKSLTPSLGE